MSYWLITPSDSGDDIFNVGWEIFVGVSGTGIGGFEQDVRIINKM